MTASMFSSSTEYSLLFLLTELTNNRNIVRCVISSLQHLRRDVLGSAGGGGSPSPCPIRFATQRQKVIVIKLAVSGICQTFNKINYANICGANRVCAPSS